MCEDAAEESGGYADDTDRADVFDVACGVADDAAEDL